MRSYDLTPLMRSTVGFDRMASLLENFARADDHGQSYPPYNIEKLANDRLRITLAVAGFTETDLSVQIEDNQLTIRGKQHDDQERVYLHRGIAARQFQRSFVLADGIEIVGATLDNGLLNIELHRPAPSSRARTISIERPRGAAEAPETIDVETEGEPS